MELILFKLAETEANRLLFEPAKYNDGDAALSVEFGEFSVGSAKMINFKY